RGAGFVAQATARSASSAACEGRLVARILAPPESRLESWLHALELGSKAAKRSRRIEEQRRRPQRVFLGDPFLPHPLQVISLALEEQLEARGLVRQLVDQGVPVARICNERSALINELRPRYRITSAVRELDITRRHARRRDPLAHRRETNEIETPCTLRHSQTYGPASNGGW